MKNRILLVEDNPLVSEVIRQELEFLGYEVITANNGVRAVEAASKELPDLILMDMLMPEMDGAEAVSRIRENPETRGIPILAATAKAMPGDKEKCLQIGCNGYIAKPFTHRDLGAAIDKLLKKPSGKT